MKISILGKIEGAWQSLGSADLSTDNSSNITIGDNYIYNNVNGMIIECLTASIVGDGSKTEIKQEITLKRAFPKSIISVACSCDSTKYSYGNLTVVAIPTGKDKVKIAIRHLDSNVNLEGNFTIYLTCFGM